MIAMMRKMGVYVGRFTRCWPAFTSHNDFNSRDTLTLE